MGAEQIPRIPQSVCLDYLNEGAANIVYTIEVTVPTPPGSILEAYGPGTPPPEAIETHLDQASCLDHEFDDSKNLEAVENKLLRLRKDLPTTLPVARSQEAWVRVIEPLFLPDQVVRQSLVRLGPHLIDRMKARLVHWENHPTEYKNPRPSRRRGAYLADDEFGLLITDMSPGSSREIVIEFKPKWLAQSPSAPKNAVRCRQCARFARTNAGLARKGDPLQKSWCPLDLNIHDGLQLAKIIWTPETFEEMFPRFSSWLSGNTLLPRLRQLQMELDPVGVLKNDKNDEQFRAAMTLRDCTVFVRFPENVEDDQYGIEARIGDLDLKSPDKAQYWKDTENALIEEGWYTGTEKKEDRQPLTCQLSPKLEDAMREMLLSNS